MSEEAKPVAKMGYEALWALVMAQFSVMTAEERAWFASDLAEVYCRRCGEPPREGESRRTQLECKCGLGYWE